MTGPKWYVTSHPCPRCSHTQLIYDGSVRWRSGARPPRSMATKGSLGKSPRADFEIAHYLHCANCSTLFYDPVDSRKPHLYTESEQVRSTDPAKSGWPPGSIGDISSRIGYDVRDLRMAGYSDIEINMVLTGQISLDELLNSKPGDQIK